MHDTVESVRALSGWLRRDATFEINDANMKDLAHLSDKYIIDSLQKDLRNYTYKWILRKDPPTYDLWHFAARYSFLELEEYCRESTPLSLEIAQVIADPTKGFVHLLNAGLPMPLVNKLVCDLLKPHAEPPPTATCTCLECGISITCGIRYRCLECDINYCQVCVTTKEISSHRHYDHTVIMAPGTDLR